MVHKSLLSTFVMALLVPYIFSYLYQSINVHQSCSYQNFSMAIVTVKSLRSQRICQLASHHNGNGEGAPTMAGRLLTFSVDLDRSFAVCHWSRSVAFLSCALSLCFHTSLVGNLLRHATPHPRRGPFHLSLWLSFLWTVSAKYSPFCLCSLSSPLKCFISDYWWTCRLICFGTLFLSGQAECVLPSRRRSLR